MKASMNFKKLSLMLFSLYGVHTWATPNLNPSSSVRRIQQPSTWNLDSHLLMAEAEPQRLLEIIEAEFSEESLKAARRSKDLAYSWQDRVAYLGALTQLFNPEAKIKASAAELKSYRQRARKLISQALLNDASLLVRDGAVESIRRINRMQPSLTSSWKASLEQAFMDRRNILDGEGLFIRETILQAIREASLSLSKSVRQSAELDQNTKVRDLLRLWSTAAYEKL